MSDSRFAVGDWVSHCCGLMAMMEGPARVLGVFMRGGEWKARIEFLDHTVEVVSQRDYFKPEWEGGEPVMEPSEP